MNRDQAIERLATLEREQRDAERMMLAAMITSGDLDLIWNALDEAMRTTGLVDPVHMGPENSSVLSAVIELLEAQVEPTPQAIKDARWHTDFPPEYVENLCWDTDPGNANAFVEATRVADLSSRRLHLGQRVWPEALYRWFDIDGQLLYIGITRNVANRQEAHARNSSWGRFASTCDVSRYPTRASVELAERHAIVQEQPLFNHVHNDTPEARQRLVEYLVAAGHLDLLSPAVSRG